MNLGAIYFPLFGGVLIGLAVTIMLLFNGRVTGISGILALSLSKPTSEGLWRWMFLFGMILGGFLLSSINRDFFLNSTGQGLYLVIVAGTLVGYGTVLGSGCTSGHGICGLSRFSVRSFVATLTFMLFGFLAVQLLGYFSAGAP